MKDNRSLFVFGMHSSILKKVMESLSEKFENIDGTTNLEKVLSILKTSPPDILVIGGGVPTEMRREIIKSNTGHTAKIMIAEPMGPHDVLDSIQRAEQGQ